VRVVVGVLGESVERGDDAFEHELVRPGCRSGEGVFVGEDQSRAGGVAVEQGVWVGVEEYGESPRVL
jgi:hypothetical protein